MQANVTVLIFILTTHYGISTDQDHNIYALIVTDNDRTHLMLTQLLFRIKFS